MMIPGSKTGRWNVYLSFFFILAAAMLWPWLRWYVNNPDSFQYIQIARHYSECRWGEAINGYWSPLVSWLMAPAIRIGIPSVELFKLLQLAIALYALFTWMRLIDRIGPPRGIGYAAKAAAVPVLLAHAYLYLTPDLLFTTLLLSLVASFIRRPVWHDTRRAMMAGFLGALLYLTKAFGLPLFFAFAAGSVFFHNRSGNKVRLPPLMAALGVFVLFCGTWIAMISSKYGHFTVSEAARFNTTKQVSPLPGQTVRLPYLYTAGLVKPAGTHALSAWEEPMKAGSSDKTMRWESVQGGGRINQLISRNLQAIWHLDFRRQAGFAFLLLLTLYLFITRSGRLRSPLFFYPLLVLVSVYSGYSMILFHARYSWICAWTMVFLSTVILVDVKGKTRPGLRVISYLLFSAVLLLAVKRPVKELLFTADKDVTASALIRSILQFGKTLDSTYYDDRSVSAVAIQLAGLDGPFASRFSDNSVRNRYFSSLSIAESAQQPYYGQYDDRAVESMEALRRNGIRYFMIWDEQVTTWQGSAPVYSCRELNVFRIR